MSRFPLAIAAALMICLPAAADSISVGTVGATGSGVTYDNVRIDHIENGQIFYFFNEQMTSRPLAEVTSLSVDGEDDFDAGEIAYEASQWAAAADAFSKALTSTQRDWLKMFMAPRLLIAANHAGRFNAAVSGWIVMVQTDSAMAARQRPDHSQATGGDLDAAAQQLDTAEKNATGDQRILLLEMLLDVQVARRDAAAIEAVAAEIKEITGQDDPNATEIVRGLRVRAQLALAQAALTQGKPDQTLQLIRGISSLVTDPAQQADALYLEAQASQANAKSPDGWNDAVIAYMRVYVHFRQGPGSEHSADALIKAAEIEENQLQEPQVAATLYGKVASEYKDTPAAQAAELAVQRLAPATRP